MHASFFRACILGGRGSTTSYFTNGEVTPWIAAGNAPVPFGRECQDAIARCWFGRWLGSFEWSSSDRQAPFGAAQPCRECSFQGTNRTGLTLTMPSSKKGCLHWKYLPLTFYMHASFFIAWVLWAGEARLRSVHMRRYLLGLLRGKSPCLLAESVSRRLRDVCLVASWEAFSGALVTDRQHSQQHSHVVSARSRAQTERGSRSPCPPSQRHCL